MDAAELTPGVLRHAIVDSGCLLVRGLFPDGEAGRLVGGIDRTLAARDAHEQGRVSEEDRAWYEPLRLPGVPHLERQRHWVTEASGVWAADSPRMAFELAELFRETGRWRKELDPEAAETINRELGPEIGAVGYEV